MDWFQSVKLPEVPNVWKRVFQPCHTEWSAEESCWPDKIDALAVLFLDNPHFIKSGVYVIREYMEWCDVSRGGNYKLDCVGKAKEFLEHRVERAKERWYDDCESGVKKNNTVEECAMNSFRSAICHLDALAQWQGYSLDLLSQECIKVMRDRISRAQNTTRAAPRDYAASSRFLTKRLTQEEMEALTECWWNGSAAERIASTSSGRELAQVRGLLFHCLQKTIGRRGADIRNLRNAMCSLLKGSGHFPKMSFFSCALLSMTSLGVVPLSSKGVSIVSTASV